MKRRLNRPARWAAALAIVLAWWLAAALWPCPPAWAGAGFRSVDLAVGGVKVNVKPGGVLAIHPDTPFRVLKVHSDQWLGSSIRLRLAIRPEVDLSRYHSLSQLLGDKVWDVKELVIQARKNDRVLGTITLVPHWLPIDYLRKAEACKSLTDKIRFTQRALRQSPDDRLLLLRLVDLLTQAKQYRRAADLLEDAARQGDDPHLLTRLAELYEKLGQKERTVAALSKLVAERPKDVVLIERLARLNEELKRWSAAARLWERLRRSLPPGQHTAVLLRLSRALAKAGQGEQSRLVLEAAAKARPWDIELWKALAQARAAAGDRAGALRALVKAAAQKPADRSLQLALSDAYLAAGDQAKAAQHLARAADLGPEDYTVLLRLANLYQELGHRRELSRVYRRLAALKPDNPELSFNLGVLLLEADQPAAALNYLQAAAEHKPKDRETRLLLFDALSRLGRWQEAVAVIKKLYQDDPKDLSPINRAYPVLSEHRPQVMAELLDRALEDHPKAVKLYQLRAALALAQDQPSQAAELLQRGLKQAPHNLEMLRSLALIQESQGQRDQALETLGRILDLAPGDEKVQERYLRLRTSGLAGSRENEKTP